MKIPQLLIIAFSLFIGTTPSFAQKKIKYKKVKNTPEVCETIKALNQHLLFKISDQDYQLTGIRALGSYNCVAVMYASFDKELPMGEVFKGIYEYLKNEDINYSRLRYIIVADYQNDILIRFGDAIAITGVDFKTNLGNYEEIKANSIQLNSNSRYENDPDLSKIINSFRTSAAYFKEYHGSPIERQKKYSDIEKMCEKAIQKNKSAF